MATNFTQTSNFIDNRQCAVLALDFDLRTLHQKLPDSVVPTWIFLSIINSTAVLPTIALNFLILWTIIENQRLRSVGYNILLACLALTDFVVGSIVQPLTVSYLVCLIVKCSSPCKMFSGLAIFTLLIICLNLCTLTMLSIERYFAVEYPIYYRRHVTKRKLLLATVLLWITFPTASIISRIYIDSSAKDLRKIPVFLFSFVNALTILYCTIKVHITAYKQRRTINIAAPDWQHRVVEQQKEQKRSLAMGVMVIASVILYSPLIVVIIIETLFGPNVTDSFKYISQVTATSFVFFQSLANPLIFSLRLSYIRRGVKGKLWCSLARHSPSPAVLGIAVIARES